MKIIEKLLASGEYFYLTAFPKAWVFVTLRSSSGLKHVFNRFRKSPFQDLVLAAVIELIS